MGETVLDIVFRDGQPERGVPGGSTLNAIVSLARSGVNTVFLSETGRDRVGREIRAFLDACGVDTRYIRQWDTMKTPVSLAFLDNENNAEYSFYRSGAAVTEPAVLPDINRDDIVIIGSFYAANTATRPQIKALLEGAKLKGAIVIYDVNYRPAHRTDLPGVMPNILENMEYADMVKGSTEDFALIFGTDDAETVYKEHVAARCPMLITTDGPRAVSIIIDGEKHCFMPEKTETVSTIGAGDNFNAGLAYSLFSRHITRHTLRTGPDADTLCHMATCAMAFATECCRHTENYISPEFAEHLG